MGHTSEFPLGIYWWTLKSPKSQTSGKMKKIEGDVIILHMCTKNHNHMRYSYWDTEWQRIYHFGPFFTLFHPLLPNNPEKQILKKWKKASGDVIIFLQQKTRSCDVCLLRYGVQQTIFCHFRPLFALLPYYWLKNQILEKM